MAIFSCSWVANLHLMTLPLDELLLDHQGDNVTESFVETTNHNQFQQILRHKGRT